MPDTKSTDGRLKTGIPGLDTLLYGGFPVGGIYLVMGPPGSGKTILSNQTSFEHIRSGGRALYVTVLSESHARMLQYLDKFTYFDRKQIPSQINYLSVFPTLEKEGVDGLIALLQLEILRFKPTLLLVDGFAVTGEIAESTVAFKKFVHQLNVFTSNTGCTAILMSSICDEFNRPEHTMVDGIIVTSLTRQGMRTSREIEVRKLRGSRHLQGRHHFQISERGLTVFPRLESLEPTPATVSQYEPDKVSTGLKDLDALIDGGFTIGTVTVILGGSGTGKTIMGLHFLDEGIRHQEPCLYLGFCERDERLMYKSRLLGMGLEQARAKGLFHVMWNLPTELFMDETAQVLLQAVQKHGIKRLFIDGSDGLLFGHLSDAQNRVRSFMTALTNELRILDVTTVITEESKTSAIGPLNFTCDSAIADNIIFLRQTEIDERLCRKLAIVKRRDGAALPAVQSMYITQRGIQIGTPFRTVDRPKASKPKAGGRTKRKH